MNAIALPRPYCCDASTGPACGRARRCRSAAPWRAGLSGSGALMLVTSGSCGQRAAEAASVVGNLRHRVRLARRAWAPTFSRASVRRLGRAGPWVDSQRQRVGHRRAAVAAFAERSRAAQHQQAAAAAIDEVGDHLQLIAGERRRPRCCRGSARGSEQLVARLRKAARPLRRDRRRAAGTCCRRSAAAPRPAGSCRRPRRGGGTSSRSAARLRNRGSARARRARRSARRARCSA